MSLGFFLKEALRALRRNSAPSLAALLTVLITALVLGVFIPIVQATTGTANEVRNRVVVDVYVKDAATTADRTEVAAHAARAPRRQDGRLHLQGAGAARARHARRATPRTRSSCSAPTRCPASFRVTPDDPDKRRRDHRRRSRRRRARRRWPPIDEVRNREDDTDKILSATGLVKGARGRLAGLLVLTSIALVANTIRLSIFARRREVEVMKLVGATNWFIRWPFVIEGVIVGFMGGVLAVLLLAIAKATFIDPLSDRFALLAAPDTIDFPVL